jgi:glutaredoxin
MARWWLPAWLARRRPALGHLDVVLYTRRGCHLCEDAWQRLRDARRRYGFAFQVLDVDTDPELRGCYGEQVPVVTVNGKVRFHGGVNSVLLERLLQSLATQGPG